MADAGAAPDSMRKISLEAKAVGKELSSLLFDSPLSFDEKNAWADLVPLMNLEEIGRLRDMLLSHLERQVFDEAEDIIFAMKAEELKRQFALAHAQADAKKALEEIEKQIDALEGAI